jgi:hypothetical protein
MDRVIGSESVTFRKRASISNERTTDGDQEELRPITMEIAQGPPVVCGFQRAFPASARQRGPKLDVCDLACRDHLRISHALPSL